MDEEEIEILNERVGKEYGKVLPIKFTDDRLPNFNWQHVNIPRSIIEKNPPVIVMKNILRHEYGHLFINPKGLDVAETMAYLAKLAGIESIHEAVNIVSDLIVDSALIKIYGMEYVKFLEIFLLPGGGEREPMMDLMASFYAVHAEKIGVKTELKATSMGRKLYKELMDKTKPFYQRVYNAYGVLKPYIKEGIKIPYSTEIIIPDINEEKARKELLKDGLDVLPDIPLINLPGVPKGLARVGAGSSGLFQVSTSPKKVDEVMMKIYKFIEYEDSGADFDVEYDIWDVGDEPEKMDALKSIENSGLMIPGITTLSREEVEGKGTDGISTVLILLDSSGSMGGRNFTAAQIAVLNILRRFKHSGVKIGFIPFAGGISDAHVIYPTVKYDEIEDLLLRIEPGGGTTIKPALKLASVLEPQLLYIITDSHISDDWEIKEMANVRKIIYIISQEEEVEKWVGEFEHVFIVSPENLIIKTKEEVIG